MQRRRFITLIFNLFICFFANNKRAFAVRSGDIKYCDSIEELRNINLSFGGKSIIVRSYYSQSKTPSGGGEFIYDKDDIDSIDNGGTIIVTKNGGRWKRVHGDILDVIDFGAKPNDPTFDSLPMIQNAIDYADKVTLSGKKYFITAPIYIRSGITFDGDGGQLVSLKEINSPFMAGAIFAPGNYHPAYWISVEKVKAKSTQSKRVITVDDCSICKIGDILRLSSVSGVDSAGFFVEDYIQLNRIIDIQRNEITLEHDIGIGGDFHVSNASPEGGIGRFGKPLFCCYDSTIKNFVIETWDYWTADTATYNVTFENITGKAKAVVYGNSFSYSSFKKISMIFNECFSELAFGSHNTNLTEIYGVAEQTGIAKNYCLSWTESGRFCTLNQFVVRLNKNCKPATILRISGHRYSTIQNGQVFLVDNHNNILSVESYGRSQVGTDSNVFSGVDIYATGSVSVVCDVFKLNEKSKLEQAVFKKIRYFGTTPKVALIRLRGRKNNLLKGLSIGIYSKNGGMIRIENAINNVVEISTPFKERMDTDVDENSRYQNKVEYLSQ